ncbi:MAG TPA: hypothetical protein VFW07_27145 [Parafilimonas sp.]|nr:hypothetical protein [Parafilimonas sp.]
MKLDELIKYLINPQDLEELYLMQGLNTESEALLIYMKGNLDLKSEIIIFELEETADNLLYKKDGISYIQLFPIDYAVELIESVLNLRTKANSNLEIAKRLLEYRQKDA